MKVTTVITMLDIDGKVNNPLYYPRGNKCNNCHQVFIDGGGLKFGKWRE
jgi:hypothetical protein